MTIDPQQLRLAADIIEARQAGQEPAWEWQTSSDQPWREGNPGHCPARNATNGYTIRLTPWTLPPCPVKGNAWHRTDGWTAEMLPEGYRPLMDGENMQVGDECDAEHHNHKPEDWTTKTGTALLLEPIVPGFFYRTRRPALPVQPMVVPYTRETLPELPFEVVCKQTGDEYLVTAKDSKMVLVGLAWTPYGNVLDYWKRRDGSPCGTEVQP